jgi:hypothetical protein
MEDVSKVINRLQKIGFNDEYIKIYAQEQIRLGKEILKCLEEEKVD